MRRFITISLAAALGLGVTAPAFAFGDEVMLNPQPLPPKEIYASRLIGRYDAVMLNPQPLPPKEKAWVKFRKIQ